jgi:hypothetical protein
MRRILHARLFVLMAATGLSASLLAQEKQHDADALAKALSNPVAALISVPFQYNYDATYGDNGERNTLNVQPVVPVSISEDWNLISRTILPIIEQHDVVPGRNQFGLGDTVQSVFFSPKAPTASGLIWGVGPAAMIPTGTDDLGADTWAIGPTFVVLKQDGPWTYGSLVNHLADVGGSRRVDISATFFQPFVSRSLGKGQTLAFNFESTYDWHASQWTVPANLTYSKVSKIGSQMVSYTGGVRGYLEGPAGHPDWGIRLAITLLYPR